MKYFLLTVSTLGLISPAFAQTSEINCTPAPDCASLGYTESSCPDGAGLKCPFGDKWFCVTDFCPNQGTLDSCPSPYTCTLEKCSNKYYKSGCQSGYDWNASSKTCTKQCDNRCENSAASLSCPSGYGTTSDGEDGCGNTCYKCCKNYELIRYESENEYCQFSSGRYFKRGDYYAVYQSADGSIYREKCSSPGGWSYGSLEECEKNGTIFCQDMFWDEICI